MLHEDFIVYRILRLRASSHVHAGLLLQKTKSCALAHGTVRLVPLNGVAFRVGLARTNHIHCFLWELLIRIIHSDIQFIVGSKSLDLLLILLLEQALYVYHLSILDEVFLRVLKAGLLKAFINAYFTLAIHSLLLLLILHMLVLSDDLLG